MEIIEGAGHFPHVEAPERFLDVLDAFLAETEPAPVSGSHLRDVLLHHRPA